MDYGVGAMTRGRFLLLLAGACALGGLGYHATRRYRNMPLREAGHPTVELRVRQYGARADARLRPAFLNAGLPYPSAEVALVAFKDMRVMEVHARAAAGAAWRLVKRYPVLGASGRAGPKLAEGDRQVPEGIYQVELLNPNSRFHLSLRLNYPNDFDRRMGRADGRTDLGTDIMIHGGTSSIGCLAMGDEAAEDLFILAARTGKEKIRVVIAPTDFRVESPPTVLLEPRWAAMLYATLCDELKQFSSEARASGFQG